MPGSPLRSSARLLLSIAAALLAWPPAAGTQPPPARHVLVIHSYEEGFVWTDGIMSGLRDALDDLPYPVELWVEHLDSQRVLSDDIEARIGDLVAAKHRDRPVDVVVASDDAAIAFVAAHAPAWFPGVPIVFCGLNNRDLVARLPAGGATGLVERFDGSLILDLALRLRPATRRVLVVTDATRTGVFVRDAYHEIAARRPGLAFEWLDGRELTLDDIEARVREAGATDVVVASGFVQDRSQRYLPRRQALTRIAAASGAPVFSPIISTLGQGLVAGMQDRGVAHGRWAGRQVGRLLAGEPIARLGVEDERPGGFVVDGSQLARWGLDPALIPPGSLVVNQPRSFYREHRTAVWTALAVATIQLAAIGWLLVNVARRRRAEGRLQVQASTLSSANEDLARALARVGEEQEARARAEAQLAQSTRLEAVGSLAGGIAHDFNNLLTVILGAAELGKAEGGPAGQTPELFEEIRRSAELAADLTRQLLAFSRRQVLAPRVLDLNAVVAEAQRLLVRLIGEPIDVRVVADPRLPAVRLDPTQVQQILINLAVNARDAMPDGGVLLLETVAVDVDDAYAVLHPTIVPGRYAAVLVTDTGAGMPPDVVERIFEPFFTTKAQGRGTGLGLATVYGIVKQSGGWVWVFSEPGRGTTFKLLFPEAPDAVSRPAGPPPEPGGRRDRGRALVVEGEPEVRRLVGRTLERAGFEVADAGSFDEALVHLDSGPPPAIVASAPQVPGGTGAEIRAAAKARNAGLKAVSLTGYAASALVDSQSPEPGLALVPKPFVAELLPARLARLFADA